MHQVQLSRIISNLQIQNKGGLNTVLQVWCSKGSLWKVRFIFEITNIGICAGVLVVARPVVSILSSSHSSQFCPVVAICEGSFTFCPSPSLPFLPIKLSSSSFFQQWGVFLMSLLVPAFNHSGFHPKLVLLAFSFTLFFLGFFFHFSDFFGLFGKLLF